MTTDNRDSTVAIAEFSGGAVATTLAKPWRQLIGSAIDKTVGTALAESCG